MTESQPAAHYREWAHGPSHLFVPGAAYFVTCGTYTKARLFNTPDKLDALQDQFFQSASAFGWQLEAWAFMSNHYHFVAQAPSSGQDLDRLIQAFHSKSAIDLNKRDKTPGRVVWYQYRDTCLNFPKSYYARLHYVHRNPVHHGLVGNAENYRWCSMGWFVRLASPGWRKTVSSFKCDKIAVDDEF
jgi:putative transposase